MRMIVVTIVAIVGTLAAIITGYTAHAVTQILIADLNQTRPIQEEAITAWDTTIGYGLNAALICTVGAMIGLVVWWALSSQQRETVTGRYG